MSSYFTLPSFARAKKNTEELEKTSLRPKLFNESRQSKSQTMERRKNYHSPRSTPGQPRAQTRSHYQRQSQRN
jgi:hypothetical protein